MSRLSHVEGKDTGWSDMGQTWFRFAKMGQIRDFSDQDSVHFGAIRQNVLNSDLKKSLICPIRGQSDNPFAQIWGLCA